MRIVGEGILPSPARSFAWSPAADLCVFVMPKEVSAHRLRGQKVWSISSNSLPSPDSEFTHVTWRGDGLTPFSRSKSIGRILATGLDDGSIYVWDVQGGRKVRQVMLNFTLQGPISCLNWIGEDQGSAVGNPGGRKDLDVEFEVESYLPLIKAISRKFLSHVNVSNC